MIAEAKKVLGDGNLDVLVNNAGGGSAPYDAPSKPWSTALLVSPRASYIQGAVPTVDGGKTAVVAM